MNDPVQSMPEIKDLCRTDITTKQWLTYYKNVWNRNLAARCIDAQNDAMLKARDPETDVISNDGLKVKVGVRLEERKMFVKDAIDLIAAIDVLLAMTPEEFQEKVLSDEALAVAEDMKQPVAAEPVTNGTDEATKKKYKVLKETPAPEAFPVDAIVELTDEEAKPLVDGYFVTLATE